MEQFYYALRQFFFYNLQFFQVDCLNYEQDLSRQINLPEYLVDK